MIQHFPFYNVERNAFTKRREGPALTLALMLIASGCRATGAPVSSLPGISQPTAIGARPQIPATITIPMQAQNSRALTPVIMVAIGGGKSVPMIFDTGSGGVRIFKDAVGPNYIHTNLAEYAYFGSRPYVYYYGKLGVGSIEIGSYTIPGNLSFQVVDTICIGRKDCSDRFIRREEHAGYYGIFGVRPYLGYRSRKYNGIYNVMGDLPGNLKTGYIVELGNGSDEKLIVGLTPQNTTGFSTYAVKTIRQPDGSIGWRRTLFPFCYTFAGTTFRQCLRQGVFVDTGGLNAWLEFTGPRPAPIVSRYGTLKTGTQMAATLKAIDWNLTAGQCPFYNLVYVGFNAGKKAGETNGATPFFSNDVMFDVSGGRLGFRPSNAPPPKGCNNLTRGTRIR